MKSILNILLCFVPYGFPQENICVLLSCCADLSFSDSISMVMMKWF